MFSNASARASTKSVRNNWQQSFAFLGFPPLWVKLKRILKYLRVVKGRFVDIIYKKTFR
jgi:hypothetical protein